MKYLLKKDLPTIKAGTEFEYKHNIFTGSYGVELVKGDTIGGLLDFINGFGIDNDFFEPIKESKVWKPKKHKTYYFIRETLSVTEEIWHNTLSDTWRLSMGNVYKTEAEATKARDKQLAIVRCRNYLIENDMLVSDEDLFNDRVDKYIVVYTKDKNGFDWYGYNYTFYYSPFGYINSKENVEQFIKDCEKDLLLIYLP